ncbi:putative flavinator of succinate dehydrogenase [Plasmopara halstedii]
MDEANRKRIIYRSKQRGWLEVDLLLGRWASENVMQLSSDQLQQYEDILNEETIDIFNYISGKCSVPKRLDTPMMKRLQEYCLTSHLLLVGIC